MIGDVQGIPRDASHSNTDNNNYWPAKWVRRWFCSRRCGPVVLLGPPLHYISQFRNWLPPLNCFDLLAILVGNSDVVPFGVLDRLSTT